MKRTKNRITGFLAAILLVCAVFGTSVSASDISLMYEDSNQCSINLLFSNNMATCSVYVAGKNGTSSISGKLKLYDVTAKKSVKTWPVYKLAASYRGSKTTAVKTGHKYKLTFTGKVYNTKRKSESISRTVTKTNK